MLGRDVGGPGPLAAGRLALRRGLGLAALLGVALLLTGTLLTAAPQLPAIVIGLAMVTFAFLGTHSLVRWQTGGWSSVITVSVALLVGAALLLVLARRFEARSCR